MSAPTPPHRPRLQLSSGAWCRVQGIQMALFSDVLPSADNAARDINLLVSAMTVSQTVRDATISLASGLHSSQECQRYRC